MSFYCFLVSVVSEEEIRYSSYKNLLYVVKCFLLLSGFSFDSLNLMCLNVKLFELNPIFGYEINVYYIWKILSYYLFKCFFFLFCILVCMFCCTSSCPTDRPLKLHFSILFLFCIIPLDFKFTDSVCLFI